jgi:hypothetical protein
MTSVRSPWIALGVAMSGLATLILAGTALGGFGGGSGGDVAVSSMPSASNLMLALGAALLLGLEFAHTIRRHPVAIRRQPSKPEPAEA